MKLKIESMRFPNCTIGKLYTITPNLETRLFAHTIERPWLDNRPDCSSVDSGFYTVKPYMSEEHGAVYILESATEGDVGEKDCKRNKIFMHKGATPSDTVGGIVIGKNVGVINGEWAVTGSGVVMRELRRLLGDKEHDLYITRR